MARDLIGVMRFFLKGYLIKQPAAHILVLFNTLAIIILLVFIGGIDYLPYALIGGITALSMSPGILQLPPDLHALKKSKFYDMIQASPVNPLIFIFGFSIGVSFASFITLVIFTIILVILLNLTIEILVIIPPILVSWIVSTLLGYYLAGKIEYTITLFRVTGLLYTSFVYLSPVYYSIKLLPTPLAYLSLLSPGTATSLIIKKLLEVEPVDINLLYLSLIILMIYLIGAILLLRKK